MNEELKVLLNQLGIEMLEKVKNGIDIASDFLGEQLPLVAQEIINWGLGEAIFWTSVFFIVTTVLMTMGFLFKKRANKYMKECNCSSWDWDSGSPYGAVFYFIFGGIFFFVMVNYAFDIVKIAVAPRLYLIEELIRMTKGAAQ